MTHHQNRLSRILDDIRNREGFAGTGHAEKGLPPISIPYTPEELFDGFRLIARRFVRAYEPVLFSGHSVHELLLIIVLLCLSWKQKELLITVVRSANRRKESFR
jgi:hypothetical protein